METLAISQSTGNATMSVPIMDDGTKLSESNVDVSENNLSIVSNAKGDAKIDNTISTGGQNNIQSVFEDSNLLGISPSLGNNKSKKIKKPWRNQHGETHLHIACK